MLSGRGQVRRKPEILMVEFIGIFFHGAFNLNADRSADRATEFTSPNSPALA